MRTTGIGACAFVLAAGFLLSGDLDAGSLEPPGPPAPTMKSLDQVEARVPISSLPITITAPGSYYLTGDLTGVSGQVGITITSSFVTLDLNGFSLNGVPGSLDGIRANVTGTRHLEIRNGAIRNWGGSGIGAIIATEVHAENLRLDSNGIDGLNVGLNSIVRDTTSSGNGGNGIAAESRSTIIGCTVRSNGVVGVLAQQNSVVSSTAASLHANNYGIIIGSGSVATDCTAQQNLAGFSLAEGSRVVHSVARLNAIGISGAEGVSIEECTVGRNTDRGIVTNRRGLVRGNVVFANTNDGIHATGNENRIEENESTGNGVGIRVDGVNNLVVKNSVGSNTTEFVIVGGNKAGAISTDPLTAGPWANFDL